MIVWIEQSNISNSIRDGLMNNKCYCDGNKQQ